MRDQFGKCLRTPPRAVTQNPSYRKLGVVINDALRDGAEMGKRLVVSFGKSFTRFRWKRHHKGRIAMRQIHREKVRPLYLSVQDDVGFTEIHLRMPRRVRP